MSALKMVALTIAWPLLLPPILEDSASRVQNPARRGPLRGLLEDSQPDGMSAANTLERQVAAKLIVVVDPFRLPVNRGWRIECGGDNRDVNLQTRWYDPPISRSAQNFCSRNEQRDFPDVSLLVVKKVTTHGGRH
jgi:hypothetical protein